MDGQGLARVLALGSAFKEGDLAVGGTHDDRVRDEARRSLAATTIGDIHRSTLVDDGVSEALHRSRDHRVDDDLSRLTVGDVRKVLLSPRAAAWVHQYGRGLASETIAAVAKVLADDELSIVARALCEAPQHFGSRIQPNSAGDDEHEILFSILEGLSYGCGDVIIGLNPAADDLDTIVRLEQLLERVVRLLELPTRFCVLSDIVKQHAARRRTTIDVGFQSLAGTSKAMINMVGLDVDGVLDLARAFDGLYFETGQGSEVTNDGAEGVDMVTLESRTYGIARYIQQETSVRWMIVNDVAGFIGPEVFRSPEQLERACLEDIVMARLHGLVMGLDVCATFHMGIPPQVLRHVTSRITERAMPDYLMAVAGNADPMLGYLTTSFREHPELRHRTRRHVRSPMRRRLEALGVFDDDDRLAASASVARLYAAYARAGGERRSIAVLEEEGAVRLNELRERGLDLGIDAAADADARLDVIYANARAALYATVDEHAIARVAARPIHVRTAASSRDHYLAHPAAGERLRDEDARALASSYPARRPQVQIVISDGLNANAVNEQVRALLPEVRRLLSDAGHHVGEREIVVENGRVRVGYEIGGLTGATLVIHLIGERPGTGLNTLSAYITYGRDDTGQPRWSRSLDHSATTAVCGIHPKGKPPQAAAVEIAKTVSRMIELRRSGVALAAIS
ncbi:MAG TPA: ethanolamine ammonia-lyase subunit EutB [Vicinamibacterales bacterium]|nr:ethanolamine ammonia-lyase subunit EutB [Vicinamibacterales bacterium]